MMITFREYKKEDEKPLGDIIRKTWRYDDFCSEGLAKNMGELYLASCLAEQTFTRVALVDDKPVGIIMGKNIKKHKKSLKYVVPQFMKITRVFMSKEGRDITKVFGGISELDKNLLKDRNRVYDGEVAFFAVSEECRGTGIGKALFNKAMDYFKGEGIRNFYLYTDSSCNYGFYEHQGLKRCGEKVFEIPIKLKNEMKFYLYEMDLEG